MAFTITEGLRHGDGDGDGDAADTNNRDRLQAECQIG